jgi:5-formaminoimidazole-4-carboxamide-1-beta-D-ribofuranosyl 5'-monophosphate synthetase
MTLRQTIQAAPDKTAELITKLTATTNQAVKTRESLFENLGEELTRYVEITEQHLLPVLRSASTPKPKTWPLVP